MSSINFQATCSVNQEHHHNPKTEEIHNCSTTIGTVDKRNIVGPSHKENVNVLSENMNINSINNCAMSKEYNSTTKAANEIVSAPVRSYSESDLRILSNRCPERDSIPTHSPHSTVCQLRSDYITLQAASKGQKNRFDSFRKKLVHQSSAICERNGGSTKTIVVIPSIDLDGDELKRISQSIEFYEERQLYHLLLLYDPSFRVIFLSTFPICDEVVKYYLSLDNCSSSILSERLSRLFLLTPGDCGYSQSLSSKVVKHQKLISTIRSIINRISKGAAPSAGLNVFCGSDTADNLAFQLKLRLLEASGKTLYYGSKQGSREIFRLSSVSHAPGCPSIDDDDLLTDLSNTETSEGRHRCIRSPRALSQGIARQIVLKNVKPKKWIIKLNHGFSGKGNATLSLEEIQNKQYRGPTGDLLSDALLVNSMAVDIEKKLPKMRFECPVVSWTAYKSQIEKLGVIAEAFLEGDNLSSPSVQAVIEQQLDDSSHGVHLLSTHEQVLNGQIYNGCINPASEHYRQQIVSYTKKIGHALAERGVVGHFAADFLVSQSNADGGRYNVSAIEINLRQGGTTHPFATMALLTGGKVSDRDAVFRTLDGKMRCYVATDAYNDQLLCGMTSKEFLQILNDEQNVDAMSLKWDNIRKIGVVFHMLDFIQLGKIGFTAIAESGENARHLFDRTTQFLQHLSEERDFRSSIKTQS